MAKNCSPPMSIERARQVAEEALHYFIPGSETYMRIQRNWRHEERRLLHEAARVGSSSRKTSE